MLIDRIAGVAPSKHGKSLRAQTIWCDDTIHGMPYGLDKYGSINIKKLLSSVTPDELYTFNLYKLEYMRIVLDDVSARTGVFSSGFFPHQR